MKVAILAGALEQEFSEYTKNIPKPRIPIKGEPILIKIIKIYVKFNITEFVIATGYKHKVIENYFIKNKILSLIYLRQKRKIFI